MICPIKNMYRERKIKRMSRDPITSDYPIQTVAVVDDMRNGGFYDLPINFTVPEMAGFTLRYVPLSLQSIDDIIDFVRETAQGVLCTHRLKQRGQTYFYGAELAAALYDAKIPTLLVTQYTAIDLNGSLRRWRDKLPVVFNPREFDTDTILDGFDLCMQELQYGNFSDTRLAHKEVCFNVVNIEFEGSEQMVDVNITYNWDHYQMIRFPMSLIPADLHPQIVHDCWLQAEVNVGAHFCDDLYFRNITLGENPEEQEP
jgi:hypothetical protein